MGRFRNAAGQRIRLESGARMNDATCCCEPVDPCCPGIYPANRGCTAVEPILVPADENQCPGEVVNIGTIGPGDHAYIVASVILSVTPPCLALGGPGAGGVSPTGEYGFLVPFCINIQPLDLDNIYIPFSDTPGSNETGPLLPTTTQDLEPGTCTNTGTWSWLTSCPVSSIAAAARRAVANFADVTSIWCPEGVDVDIFGEWKVEIGDPIFCYCIPPCSSCFCAGLEDCNEEGDDTSELCCDEDPTFCSGS